MEEVSSNYYSNHHWKVQYQGFLGKFTDSYHKKIESERNSNHRFETVLEVGGGTGEHIQYVEHDFSRYYLLDLFVNRDGLKKLMSDHRSKKIEFIEGDARRIPFQDLNFDRVVSTCVLHHISDLEKALEEIRRVCKDGATIDLYVPCDPGMIYRWTRHWTSHRKQKNSMKLSMRRIKYLWAIEHSNHYLGIISLIEEIFSFDRIKIRRYPFRITSWNFSLFSIVSIKVSKSFK